MGNLKKTTKFTLLTLIVLLGQLSCTQEKVENRNTLNTYTNGQLMREHVKYKDNDTIVEFIYFQNGKLNYKRQLLNNQRTGWSYTYNKKGDLQYRESYLNGNLTGEFTVFYPTGQISRIEHYQGNSNIDTTTYYSKNGQVTKKVVFLAPCEFGSCECDQLVVVYESGSKIYSFEVQNGLKSKDHEVYDQAVYLELIAKNGQEPLYEKGKSIFRNNCGMCHKIDNQLVGLGLSSFTKTMVADELVQIIGGGKGHPMIKLTEKEAEELIEYINRNCP